MAVFLVVALALGLPCPCVPPGPSCGPCWVCRGAGPAGWQRHPAGRVMALLPARDLVALGAAGCVVWSCGGLRAWARCCCAVPRGGAAGLVSRCSFWRVGIAPRGTTGPACSYKTPPSMRFMHNYAAMMHAPAVLGFVVAWLRFSLFCLINRQKCTVFCVFAPICPQCPQEKTVCPQNFWGQFFLLKSCS